MNKAVTETLAVVEETCREFGMLDHNGKVIVGVSGGADSMMLLHFLMNHVNPLRMVVAHINHGIRGKEADEDEVFVEKYCEEHGLKFVSIHLNIPALSEEKGIGEEECGREERYRFFKSLAAVEDRIYTAHTLSDSCETVLFHLAIGTGTNGLRGIPPIRGQIARPLIRISREQVEEYCAFYTVPFRNDSTNSSREYSRNYIRHEIMPKFKALNSSFEIAVLRMTKIIEQDECCLSQRAIEVFEEIKKDNQCFNVAELLMQPSAIIHRVLKLIAEKAGAGRLEAFHIEQGEALLKKGNGKLSLPGKFCFAVSQGLLICEKENSLAENDSFLILYCDPGVTLPDGRKISIDKIPVEELKSKNINNLFATELFDYDIIKDSIILRTRREGDVFMPKYRGINKKLKKLQNEMHIPMSERKRSIILESNGEIVWVEKIGCADRFKITDKSKNAAVVTIHDF